MAITFPTKSEKAFGLLVDAMRVIAWQEYKATNKEELKNLEYGGYSVFEAEWKEHEIHEMKYLQIAQMVQEMGYTVNEMLNLRSQYYASKIKRQKKTTSTTKYEEQEPF
ncbi:hypothetical protein [Microcoleus sp. bin38.metabat.b11b12b14.051]|uniref:hypothetical protein n=1 Tax=Microcoleus sp. bin38.metabat.b11b12b14.051 TaxID=2742709 RepID=UPI0025F1554B|nr:hypothetical protein [Microcoleus sp. bin38.metabat.b11b12b14.051]